MTAIGTAIRTVSMTRSVTRVVNRTETGTETGIVTGIVTGTCAKIAAAAAAVKIYPVSPFLYVLPVQKVRTGHVSELERVQNDTKRTKPSEMSE